MELDEPATVRTSCVPEGPKGSCYEYRHAGLRDTLRRRLHAVEHDDGRVCARSAFRGTWLWRPLERVSGCTMQGYHLVRRQDGAAGTAVRAQSGRLEPDGGPLPSYALRWPDPVVPLWHQAGVLPGYAVDGAAAVWQPHQERPRRTSGVVQFGNKGSAL